MARRAALAMVAAILGGCFATPDWVAALDAPCAGSEVSRAFAMVPQGIAFEPDARQHALVLAALSDWPRALPPWNLKNARLAVNRDGWWIDSDELHPDEAEERGCWTLHDGRAELERYFTPDSLETSPIGARLPRAGLHVVRIAGTNSDVLACALPGMLLVLDPATETWWCLDERAPP